MKELAIYCAGGFGREVYGLIFNKIIPALQEGSIKENANDIDADTRFVGFFDDGIEKGTKLQYGTCLGGMDDLNAWQTPLYVVIANGSPKMLKHISESVYNNNVSFPNIVHPFVTYTDFSTLQLGKGNLIIYGCRFSVNVQIGDFNVFNSDDTFGHETIVGNCNAFMPGVRVSGGVTIGNENLFGANSFIYQGLKVGNNVHLSPGSIMITKPKDGGTYIGNPATRLKY